MPYEIGRIAELKCKLTAVTFYKSLLEFFILEEKEKYSNGPPTTSLASEAYFLDRHKVTFKYENLFPRSDTTQETDGIPLGKIYFCGRDF